MTNSVKLSVAFVIVTFTTITCTQRVLETRSKDEKTPSAGQIATDQQPGVGQQAPTQPGPMAHAYGPVLTHDGVGLYGQHCQQCHGPLGKSSIQGTSLAAIQTAIAHIQEMKTPTLQALNVGQLNAIVAALGSEDTVCRQQGVPAKVAMRRLSFQEVRANLLQILGNVAIPEFPTEHRGKSFLTTSVVQKMGPGAVEDLFEVFRQVLDNFLASGFNSLEKTALLACNYDNRAEACQRTIYTNFTSHLALGTARQTELVASAVAAAQMRMSATNSLKAGFLYLMMSPDFLYRLEQTAINPTAGANPISEVELAKRLSLFLWGTFPDAQLMTAASTNNLRKTLDVQVTRMLADPRSRYLVDSFGHDLLHLFELKADAEAEEDPPVPLDLLKAESLGLIEHFFQATTNVLGMFTANFSYINNTLAEYYGLPTPNSADLIRKDHPKNSPRHGILTNASWLTATSGEETSPTKRGAWITDMIMCEILPETPDVIPEIDRMSTAQTLKQKLAAHSTNPTCAVCHSVIDPAGIPFENFDAQGLVRTNYANGQPVDTTTVLTDGTQIANHMDYLERIPQSIPAQKCFVKHVFSFAVAKDYDLHDACEINSIYTKLAGKPFTFQSVVLAVAKSHSFNHR